MLALKRHLYFVIAWQLLSNSAAHAAASAESTFQFWILASAQAPAIDLPSTEEMDPDSKCFLKMMREEDPHSHVSQILKAYLDWRISRLPDFLKPHVDEFLANKVVFDSKTMFTPLTYYFSVIGQVENFIQSTQLNRSTLASLSGFALSLLDLSPATVGAIRRFKSKIYESQWQALQLLTPSVVQAELSQLVQRIPSDSSYKELLHDVQLTQEQDRTGYRSYRWQKESAVVWLNHYVGPKTMGALAATCYLLFN